MNLMKIYFVKIIDKLDDSSKISIRISTVFIAILLVFYIFKEILIPVPSMVFLSLALIFVLFVIILTLTFTRISTKWINHFMLTIGYFYLLKANLNWGVLESPYLNWVVFVVLCSAFLTGTRGFLFWIFMALVHPVLLLLIARSFYPDVRFSLNKTLIEIATGSSLISLIILFSITLMTFANIALKRYRRISESKVVMAELIRILTYDISFPIQSIKNTAENLQQSFPEGNGNSPYIKKIVVATQVIQTITARVQKLKELHHENASCENYYFDLGEVCEKGINLYRDKADQKKIELEFIKTNELNPVFAEKDVLTFQVLPNILSNAIKFSDNNSVITITASPGKLVIRDQGIGIPKEIQNVIFSYRNRTNRLGTHGEEGTGFGMPLVKTLLERMDAKINIKSWDRNEFPENHGTEIEILFKVNCEC